MSDEDRSTAVESKKADDLDRKTLFVRSIPFEVTSEQLSDHFSQFCPVKHAVIVTDRENKSRGFGFVSFSLDEDTLTALEKAKKSKFNGRVLRVDIAKRRDRKTDKESNPREVKPKKEEIEKRKARLIIRNLPWSVRDPEQLKKLFTKYGAVSDAIIPRKGGGKMSGFAFITMKKNVSAEKAIKGSAGLKIDGREVAVDFAIEKSKWLQYKEENEVEEESESEDEEEEDDDEDKENDDDQEVEDQDSDDADVANEEDDDSDIELESDEEVDGAAEEEEEKPKPKNRQDQFSLFIRNIPYDTDEEDLKEHFEQFGAVKYALPVVDKQTGIARGTAFVAFYEDEAYKKCLDSAPDSSTASILISDDVAPEYVFQGRILSISPTVDRDSAAGLSERNAKKRSELLGKAPGEKDRRNLYLLNEGRITENSKLASALSKSDLELREKSYKVRVQNLNKNPSLHMSLTRLAIRNLPRAMNAKALKALGRKAVVQFATEVKDQKRHPLSKEEINRSTKEKQKWLVGEEESKKKSKLGVIRQAKIIMEVKGSGDAGRSRGYGFLEFRDHKSALMGLRWMNAHEVTPQEIFEGLTDDEKKTVKFEGLSKRKLIAEFAIEHANVVKRRRDKITVARQQGGDSKRSRHDIEGDEEETEERDGKRQRTFDRKGGKKPQRKGNMNKGVHVGKKPEGSAAANEAKSGLNDETKKLIGMKRKRKQNKGGK